MSSSTDPENPHLVDIFRTAMAPATAPEEEKAATPRIVVNGNNNVVAFGGGPIVINERQTTRAKRA